MVKTGLDVLLESYCDLLSGSRVGIITNPSGVTKDLVQNVDALTKKGIKITAIYAPEHGFRAAAKEGEKVESYTDKKTGIPVYSLYGETKNPSADMLSNVDWILFDIQDAGARFYTFISTLLDIAQSCKTHKKKLLVLDRPNPINGNRIEGNILDMNFKTFVGSSPIPIRYGLTLGELALFYNAHFKIGLKEAIIGKTTKTLKDEDLVIIPLSGWKRSMWYDQTGLQWVPPSPNFATVDTAAIFPGACYIEGTNLSEGRGTVKPFEWIGAPYIDEDKWTDCLNELNLPGVRFRPTYFVPRYSKNEGKLCRGIQIHILDREKMVPTTIGLSLLYTLHKLFPTDLQWIKFKKYFVDNLLGTDTVRIAIEAGKPIEPIIEAWAKDSETFRKTRKPFLIYS